MKILRPLYKILASCTLLLTCAACTSSEASAPQVTDGLRVERGSLVRHTLLTGELEAADRIELVTPNVNIWPVQIKWVVDDGAEVEEGDLLVEFDSSQITSNLEELRATVRRHANDLSARRSQAAADETEAVLEMERSQAAYDKARLAAEIPEGLESRMSYQRKQLDYETARLELEEAKGKLAQNKTLAQTDIAIHELALEKAQSQVAEAELGARNLSLNAPRQGIVLVSEDRNQGRAFKSGDSAYPGTVVASLPELSTLRVNARLFDVDDGRVQPGMVAEAVLDAFPDRPYRGKVTHVEQIAQQPGRWSTRSYFRVLVELETVEVERMRPGMSVRVSIAAPPEEDVLLVPRDSLRWVEQEPLARLADGREVAVQLGNCNASHCVLLEGLEEGSQLGRAEGLS